ncbi:putative fg-gap repeat domain-containing protein [Colletotrichum asianum]
MKVAVRFADLAGNNRADYLCIASDGIVSGYLQQGSGVFVDVGQIKSAIGTDQANLRWADVDGDEKNDMLWSEKFSGDTWVQRRPQFPGHRWWLFFFWRVQEKKAYYGLAAWSCIYHADLDGNDHAVEHYILESFNNKVTGGGSGGDHTPYVPNPKDDKPLPTCPDASKLDRPLVWTTIRITILLQFVQDSLARYDEIMASSYEKYFKIYTDYLVSNSWSALRSFLLKRGDEYFTCKTTEETTCCNRAYRASGVGILAMSRDLTTESAATQTPLSHVLRLFTTRNDENTTHWSLRSDKEGDFWNAPAADVGAPREKMNIAKLQSSGTLHSSCSRDAGFNTDDVTKPKTILNKALGDAKPLIDQLSAPLFEIQAMSLEADPEDIVDSVSMSILLIRDSVAFLENVVEMGKQLEEADKRSFILNLLSPIFLVVSMGGSTLTSAGLTSLGRAFVAIGEGAGIGLEIYDMVQTPSATPLDLFGILFSVKVTPKRLPWPDVQCLTQTSLELAQRPLPNWNKSLRDARDWMCLRYN